MLSPCFMSFMMRAISASLGSGVTPSSFSFCSTYLRVAVQGKGTTCMGGKHG